MKIDALAAAVVAADDAVKAAKRNLELLKAEFEARMTNRAEKFVMVGNRKVAVEEVHPRVFAENILAQRLAADVFDAIAPRKVGAGNFDAAVKAGLIPADVIEDAVSYEDDTRVKVY